MKRQLRIAGTLVALFGVLLVAKAQLPSSYPGLTAAPADRRGEEQTFLTFPEWFLVFSPAEYAQFVHAHTPDQFCFWGHIGQFWHSYASVIHETRVRDEPTNWGYHVMINVIGVSTTVEYAVRSAYETVIGRLTATFSGSGTAEEEYGARVAQEYVDFIRVRPWYEFDFAARLKGLWTDTGFRGPHVLRRLERRYALTTEYAVKAAYGWLIKIGTKASYDAPIPTTAVVVEAWPACNSATPDVKVLRQDSGAALLALPRYEAFSNAALALSRCGAQFIEIAGNRTVIAVSTIAPLQNAVPAGVEVMLRQPIITNPGNERVVLVIPVATLARTLVALEAQGASIEHVFDY